MLCFLQPKRLAAAIAATIALFAFGSVNAATLQLDFSVSFGDLLDPDTAAPAGPAPYLTAFFDDGGNAGSVTLTLTVAGTVGAADVTEVYLNVNPAIDLGSMTITAAGGTGPVANNILIATDAYMADDDGLYDILFDLPPPPGSNSARFNAGETLIYNITATGLLASSFNFASTPSGAMGPFLGAAFFQSTGVDGEQSDWVGVVVPVPAAAWLFGSALGLLGWMRRKSAG